jgi:prepilin-type N-terminal cleavage/methylation domain-containing protein
MPRRPISRRAASVSGFTLLELLVTLVVLGFVTAILAQAMSQFFRIDRVLATTTLPAQAEAVRIDWVRQALDALQPPDAMGRYGLKASARHLEGTSGNPLADGPAGFGQIDLTLAFDADTGQTALLAALPGRAAPIALLKWDGDLGRFGYYDAKGKRSDSWPPPLDAHDALPAVIVLETGLDSAAAIVAAPLISNEENPSRLQIEQL